MGCKLVEITININNTFGAETANECTVWWWFKFCKGDESLEDAECSGQPLEGDSYQLKASSKLTLPEKLPKNSMLTMLWLCGIWSKLERWTSLISGCLMSWLNIKKIIVLKCHLLLLYTTTTNHFSIWSWHAMKSRFYTTASNDQLSGWTKMKLQSTSHSQMCTKKKKDRGHCLVFYCPSYPLQLSESWQNHYIWEVCSANRWDAWKTAMPAATLVNRKGPVLPHDNAWPHVTQPVIQKLNKLGYKVLPHPPYSPDLLPTNFCKHLNSFLQGKCFHNQQEAENASQEFIESQSMDFYATGINNLISHWQKCVDCNVSYFD